MTHYDILQVTQTASPEVIQMAYKALVKKYHPDVYQGDITFATQKIKEINEAYRILSSPVLRQEYDRAINLSSTQNQRTNTQHTYNSGYNSQHNTSTTNTSYSSQYTNTGYNTYNSTTNTYSKPSKSTTKKYLFILIAIMIAFFFAFGNKEKEPDIPVPYSGQILAGKSYYNESEITVKSSSSEDCVVKLKTANGTTRVMFYVRAGQTVTVGVPAESLYVYFASGKKWYGTEELFGKNTQYSKDAQICNFRDYTWEYTLTPVSGGNFNDTPVNASEFN